MRFKCVILSAFDGFRFKCTVTLCQLSSSENKERSFGSSRHKVILQGHWTGASFLLHASFLKKSSIFPFEPLHHPHARNSWASEMNSWLSDDIFTLQNCYLTGWWVNSFRSLEQLNSCLPHVSCIASFQNRFCPCLRLDFLFRQGALRLWKQNACITLVWFANKISK